jgi:hypothetical protein
VPVKRRQKTAPLGAVFGALSTAPLAVGLAALGSYPKLQRFRAPMRKLVVRWRRLIHFPSQSAEFSSQYRFITVD